MARICIFCRKPAGNREHILANWINAVLKEDPRGFQIPVNMKLTGDDGTVRRWQGKHQITWITKRVCAKCNNEWMSGLEDRARLVLTPLIRGESVVLGGDAQAAIATWASKTFLLARFGHQQPAPVAFAWADWLYKHQSPIPGWHVWLAAYDGAEPVWYDGRDVRLQAHGPWPVRAELRKHAVLGTLVLGYLALQVLGLPEVWPPELPASQALKIWPASTAIQYWPPAVRLNDSSLLTFSRRLLDIPVPLAC